MGGDRDFRLLSGGLIRNLPADLTAVIVLVLLTNVAVLAPILGETPLRIVLGLPFVLFLPGYAIITALFPEDRSATNVERDTASDAPLNFPGGGIDGLERVALSFGLSITVVPLVGLLLNFTPWGLGLLPVLLSVSAVTLGATLVAASRRLALPVDQRFTVPYRDWIAGVWSGFFETESQTDTALNALLAVSIVVAVATVGYTITVPQQGEPFSEFYLLTGNDTGNLTADNYPENLTLGESSQLTIGIQNNEHRSIEYTVIVEIQRVAFRNNSTRVIQSDRIDRFGTTLDANETWHRQHQVTPTMTGDRLRLAYLLYNGDPPSDPSVQNAYREVHLWINVSSRV